MMFHKLDLNFPSACISVADVNMTCPPGKMYTSCGSACPLSCDNYTSQVLCTSQCVPGCFCPQGMVDYRGRCVQPSQCPSTTRTWVELCMHIFVCGLCAYVCVFCWKDVVLKYRLGGKTNVGICHQRTFNPPYLPDYQAQVNWDFRFYFYWWVVLL